MDIAGNQLRHTDGSFTRAYHVALNNTIFSEEALHRKPHRRTCSTVRTRKPADTIIQFRLSVSPDPGRAIQRHLRSRDEENDSPHKPGLLHMMGTCFYQDAASWRRLQATHSLCLGSRSRKTLATTKVAKAWAHFFPTLKRELALRGKLGFIKALAQTLSETSNDRITRRTIERRTTGNGRKPKRLSDSN